MPTPARLHANDEGETLIELVMAVAIMGIAVVAIVAGIATSILMSDTHRKQTTAGAYVRNYAEAVQTYVAIPGNFNTSASPSYSLAQVLNGNTWATFTAPNGGLNPPVTSVKCWNDTTKLFGGCVAGNAVQQITLSVASTDSRATESLVVVVRKP